MVKFSYVLVGIFVLMLSLSFASAWEFNGTVHDSNGNLLNNTLINITIYSGAGGPPSLVGSNSTYSNASGWFNLSVSENADWMYKPVITYTNSTTGAIDYIGQSLPQFPYLQFVNTTGISFYLKPAGTINITAVNSTGGRVTFGYYVKDTLLGYPIQTGGFDSGVSEAIIYAPRDRNYSIEIFPNQAIPKAFNWNNFSSLSSYNTSLLTYYNATTHTIQKTFNSTDSNIRITGYIQNSSGGDFADWNEFKVVPFLLEPGNMIYLGSNGGMPYNMSAWIEQSDDYNLTSGFYNITLPTTAEGVSYILFATARNGSGYYGGYKNISLTYSSSSLQTNFTMYPLMSTSWASANSNITLNGAVGGSFNISTAKQQFNLVNSSNGTISSINAHLEITVDYANYGANEFSFMNDISNAAGNFYLPLLNASIKEINIFSQSYAPKSVPEKTAAQILSNSNITMTTFNPGDINGNDISSSVQIKMYTSNSTCNYPNPDGSCVIGSTSAMTVFNPLTAIIGGGALNFRMGLLSSGIIVEYINVDMLASGPPDALFDDSATTSTSGGFDSAMRFGSNGPKIYDYALISMPYTQGSTNTTGLNENADVNMSIPVIYDENWRVIWNATANGTGGNALAGNYSHYSAHSSEWQTLMGGNNCTRNQSEFNSTSPCYLDTSSDRIWIRIPHFSGTQPSVTGNLISASSDTTSSSSSSSGVVTSAWTRTFSYNDKELSEKGEIVKELGSKERISIKVDGSTHHVGVIELTSTTATINISSTPQQATLLIGESKKFEVSGDNYYDLLVRLNSINNSKANFTISSLHELMPVVTNTGSGSNLTDSNLTGSGTTEEELQKRSKTMWIIVGIIAVLVIIGGGYYWFKKKNKDVSHRVKIREGRFY